MGGATPYFPLLSPLFEGIRGASLIPRLRNMVSKPKRRPE